MPMEQALIGVDIGTSNIKAAAFLPNGQQLHKVSTATQTHYPQPDWAYFEPTEIWHAISSTLRQLMKALPNNVVPSGIAFTSMAESAVPLDASDGPLHEIIAWFDRRTAPQAEWWAEHIGAEKTARITGLPVKTIFGILKLMWIRDNAPQVYQATRCWLNMADYGVFKLCGVKATDFSLASRMMVLDLDNRCWSESLLSEAGLDGSKLAELVPSGQLLGHVSAEAAAQTGLPQGLPVCSGGHDHVCGSFALGITDPGDVYDSMGTAESLFIATRNPVLDPRLTGAGIGQGLHVVPGRGYAMGGIYFSGGCIEWVRQALLDNVPSNVKGSSTDSFAHLIEIAKEVPPGSGGVFFLPHLRQANPPITDPHSRGAFVGLSSDTTGAHLSRAVLEGLAFEYQQAYDSMMERFGLTPSRIIASGGGTRNELLMEIKAAVAGQAITVPNIDEATCLGAAMLAGIGAGVYSSFEEARDSISFEMNQVECNDRLHSYYQERYETVFKTLYNVLKETHWQISDWIQAEQ